MQRGLTRFQPFSFDARDAARKVERERRLQEMRQMQEQQWVRALSSVKTVTLKML